MELGRPPLVWQWAVVSGETQVLNSNSTSAVQDPPSGRSEGGARDACPTPRRGSKFFQFHAVFGKIWRPLESWRPYLGEILDPPLHSPPNRQTPLKTSPSVAGGKNQLLTNKVVLYSSSILRIRPSHTHSWSVCLILITKCCVDCTSDISAKFLELSRYAFTY